MEVFFAEKCGEGICRLEREEANHCIKVLRHRVGDGISVIDGAGTMFRCVIEAVFPDAAQARIVEAFPGWGSHPYHLTLAVCPTKNNDRYEWFAEKATEIGVDRIVPVIGGHSERRIFKTDRCRKIMLSATKQSLKSSVPCIAEPVSVPDYIKSVAGEDGVLKLIAYCFEGDAERISVKSALDSYRGDSVAVLIGPEGDFSGEEVSLALSAGFIPVHFGDSRLRTETAGVAAAAAVYFRYM